MPRVAPMPADERRKTLMDATRPLLLEHGMAVSTRQIAHAAGVAEGTIFRVFETKQDLIDAVIVDALSPDPVVAAIESLSSQRSLPQIMTAIVAHLQEAIEQTRALTTLAMQRLRDEGRPGCPAQPFREQHVDIANAIERVLQPHASELTVPVRLAAEVIFAMSFASRHSLVTSAALADPTTICSLLLHGIAKDPAR